MCALVTGVQTCALPIYGFQDARAQHFEQTWDDDHDSRAHFLDIGCQLFEALGIIDLRAKSDGEKLPARMFISVARSEEHTSDLQSPMRISYAVFCLKKTTHIHHS